MSENTGDKIKVSASNQKSGYFFGKISLNIILAIWSFVKYIAKGSLYILSIFVSIFFYSARGILNIFGLLISPFNKNKKEKGMYTLASDQNHNKNKRFTIAPNSVSKDLIESKRKLAEELKQDAKRSSEPIIYRVTAKDPSGKIRTDSYTGFSKQDVNAFLLNEGYEVYKIETSDSINFIYNQNSSIPFLSNKLSKKDLIFWLTQLSTYVKSGISLTEAMRILAKQMGKKGKPNKYFSAVVYELTMGNSFSVALEKQGNVFPPLLINMLKAAEATGELEETLDDMAEYYDEIGKTRKQMVSAMTYPVVIMIFALAVVTFIMLYIIPQFVQIFESSGTELNGLTKFILNLSFFLKDYILIILLVAIIAIIGSYFAYLKIKAFRKGVQIVLMKVPVVGKVMIYNEMTIFSKTFASLLKNNVFITDSIDILCKITNNEVYKQLMIDTIANVAKGDKISKSFENHWAVPDVAYYMIVTGESTGELASMMSKVSAYYQEQHRNIINAMKSLIEPFLIVFLALIVGVVVISVVVPMFQMYDTVGM